MTDQTQTKPTKEQLLEAGAALQTIGARLYCFNVGIPLEHIVEEATVTMDSLNRLVENIALLRDGEGPFMVIHDGTKELLEYRQEANRERLDAITALIACGANDVIAKLKEALDGNYSTE